MSLSLLILSKNTYGSEAVGYYSNGNITDSISVFDYKTPVHKLFLSRKRFYSTDEMLSLLTATSDFIRYNISERDLLEVGDLSNFDGGKANGHASHQNGLDVDLVYLKNNHRLQSPTDEYWDEDFVVNSAPTSNFNLEGNYSLFNYLVSSMPVTRIFVDISIKKAMCNYVQRIGKMNDPEAIQTLRRLRPQELHRTHLHVRIGCPVTDPNCVPQTEPPMETGCDELSLMLDGKLEKVGC